MERPLGGTETAIIQVAKQLSERGHEVEVFTSHPNPPDSHPRYSPIKAIDRAQPMDLFVFVKEWMPSLFRVPAKAKLYWTGDSFDQYVNFGLGDRRVIERIDRFLAVSHWQARALSERSGFSFEKARVIGNGVDLSQFSGAETRERKRLIYASAPYRGLDLVPPLYSELKKKHPDLELHVFAGLSIYDGMTPFQGPEQEQFEKLTTVLRSLPDCHVHGNIKQTELAREFMKSSILFYPNTFIETSCMTAMEAMAAGAIVVTSNLGALPETIGDTGVLIDGQPGSGDYNRAFVAAVDRLLLDSESFETLSRRARARAEAEFSWGRVADRFEKVATELLKN